MALFYNSIHPSLFLCCTGLLPCCVGCAIAAPRMPQVLPSLGRVQNNATEKQLGRRPDPMWNHLNWAQRDDMSLAHPPTGQSPTVHL